MMMRTRESAVAVNKILHKYADIMMGRLGLPNPERNIYIITVVVEGTREKVNSLIEDLKKIKGVKLSALSL